jgi:hypothetical protein
LTENLAGPPANPDAKARYPDPARWRRVAADKAEGWRAAAAAMTIPFDHELVEQPQAEGLTRRPVGPHAAALARVRERGRDRIAA